MQNGIALIETEMMWLSVPEKISNYMDAIIGVNPDFFLKYVDCEKRQVIPDLVFTLWRDRGADFALGLFDGS